ncbi:hypothetical protein Ciccas_006472 [Cichlidogyrus casuarinus]|uniref:Uncharacterized protein n=1 Tax=Cichlidogyrus casuarinus TaxID=1844966 RepID=A0ABD2Q627_9PLAT
MVQFLSIFFWLNVQWIGKEKGKSIWTKVKHAKVFSLFAGTNSWECFENVSVNYAPENVLPAGIERMNIFIYRRIFISLNVFLESHPELVAISELRLQFNFDGTAEQGKYKLWPLLCSIDLRLRPAFAPFPVGYFFGTDQPILRALFSHVVDDLLAARFTFQSSLGTLHSISFSPFALDAQAVANFLGCKQHNSICFCCGARPTGRGHRYTENFFPPLITDAAYRNRNLPTDFFLADTQEPGSHPLEQKAICVLNKVVIIDECWRQMPIPLWPLNKRVVTDGPDLDNFYVSLVCHHLNSPFVIRPWKEADTRDSFVATITGYYRIESISSYPDELACRRLINQNPVWAHPASSIIVS